MNAIELEGVLALGKSVRVNNVVERAVAMFEGPSEFARRLGVVAGKEISRQAVYNWRERGGFSREIISAVHRLTKIPYSDLLASMVYDDGEPPDSESA